MALVFLAVDFPPARGGIQTISYELPLALQRAGQEIGVVTLCQDDAGKFDAECPYPVVRIPGGTKFQIAANLAMGVRDLAHQFNSDITACIATKWFPEGLAATWHLGQFGPSVALIAHGREFRLHGVNLLKWALQRYILQQVHLDFAVSHWTADQLARAGVHSNRIHVLTNGIRAERFAEAPGTSDLRRALDLGDEPILLTTSRLVARKGHADVIRLLPALIDRVGPVTYIIVGDGPEGRNLRQRAAEAGVVNHVRFTGNVSDEDLPAYYHLCDVFVMPTRVVCGDPLEGFGIVYLEANAAGKPVVGTDVGGVADAIADGVSGLLVPPNDDGALVDALASLLADPERARQLGNAGRQRVREQFTWDQVATRFLEGMERLKTRSK